MSLNLAVDILGWAGAIALLAAYAAVSTGRLAGTSYRFQILNVIGSACLILNSGYYRAFPSAFVNVVWIGIAAVTMIKRQKKPPK